MPNPCQNGGTCVKTTNGHRCDCTTKYTGSSCQTATRACGGLLDSSSGTLIYPIEGTYQHNSRCAWLIRTNVTQVLNVTFNKFNIEQSSDCRYDWLQIHDGRSSASFMIGRFCGTTLPNNGNIISTHNMLYLWFRSDNSTTHSGFSLTWNSIAPVCGGEIDATTSLYGTIASPGSPGNYPPNRDCLWVIRSSPGKRIQLNFFGLKLESHESCDYDYLAIHNGDTDEHPLLEKFCNSTQPAPLLAPQNEVTLHFHSDGDSTDTGFQIHYSVVEGIPGCGGTFTNLRGEFGSPVEDGRYPHNMVCDYVIKLPPNIKIAIEFKEFHLEQHSMCQFDYLAVSLPIF